MPDWIYALDIGTRKVAGLVGRRTATGVEVLDLEVREHSERSMLDGQVHDVEAVAGVVRSVTRELEHRLGFPLPVAAVAAAGRALKTSAHTSRLELPGDRPVQPEDLRRLERTALETAHRSRGSGFHCVGYAPMAYRLDGQTYRSVLEQRGRVVEVDLLATFLPQPVLDGLLGVCHLAGLKAEWITLEPIAALEAVIPPDLRMLNLALVDVGAGTSDIAVVRDGRILAFAMVPMAGDEVTEALCHHWVLDFEHAEDLKRKLSVSADDPIESRDIFGNPLRIMPAEARRSVQGVLKELSRTISDRILELNHGSPAAVVLVGGGSSTVGLAEQLSVDLNLEKRRIGVRRPNQALHLDDRTGRLTEAWGVTPAGILLVAAAEKGLRIHRILVNGSPHPLLQVGESLTLSDLLSSTGWPPPGQPSPRGRDLRFTVNGQPRLLEGKPGTPSRYRFGDRTLACQDTLSEGDALTVEAPRPGEDARLTAGELRSELTEISFFLNSVPVTLRARVTLEGRRLEDGDVIPDAAAISLYRSETLREALEEQGFEIGDEISRQILVSLNGQPTYLTQRNYRLTVGGREVDFDYRVRDGDVVEFSRNAQSQYRIRDVVPLPKDGASIRLIVNGHPFVLSGEPGRIFMNGQPVSPDEFIIDHATLITRDGRPATGLVSHVLAQMEKPHATRPGQRLVLTVDGQPAGFTTEVREGSQVVIAFE